MNLVNRNLKIFAMNADTACNRIRTEVAVCYVIVQFTTRNQLGELYCGSNLRLVPKATTRPTDGPRYESRNVWSVRC